MKKFLFLTALFTSLLIGFAACSDNDDEVYRNVGIPTIWCNVVGELFQTDGVYFFRATDSDNEHLLKELKDSVFPISTGSIKHYSIKIDKYIGYVNMEVPDVVKDSIWVKSIVPAKSNSNPRSKFITPEFNTSPPAWFFEPRSRATFQKDGRYEMINVFVHVVLDSSGNVPWTIDKDYIASEVVRVLNQYHGMNTHIFFKLIGTDYINYITSSFNLDRDYNNIFIKKYESGALNIYVPYKRLPGSFDGIAGDIISSCCLLQFDYYNTPVLVHETGHCLGLYHTHHGTDPKEPYDSDNKTRAIPELVNGTNADKAGDYIKDTAADPNCWTNDGKYDTSKGLKDANGQFYKPDPENLMSYSGAYTINKFSDLQIEKMHETIENSSIVTEMAARRISPTESDMGGTGNLHFSERTKTLTFPVAADDEVVTWTISQRSSSGNATYEASPKVTKVTGQSITLTHNSLSDYFEVYATTMTLYGKERKSKVWKATAGVPSAAVGTLKWTGGDGTSGSFPGYSPTLVLRNYDTSLDLKYTDLANPTYRSGVKYRLYTSAGGMLESSYGDFCISEMDCSRGYVEVQAVDNCCGADGIRWRINCESRFDMFSLDMKNGQLMIGVKPATAQSAIPEKDSAKRNLTIRSIKITTPQGRVLSGRTLDTPQRAMSLSTAGMAKGQYQIEITDVDGNVHKGHFGV